MTAEKWQLVQTQIASLRAKITSQLALVDELERGLARQYHIDTHGGHISVFDECVLYYRLKNPGASQDAAEHYARIYAGKI